MILKMAVTFGNPLLPLLPFNDRVSTKQAKVIGSEWSLTNNHLKF